MTQPSEVEVRTEGAVLIAVINRHYRRNAVNQAVALGLAAAMDRLDDDPTLRVGIVTGAGGTFCAGMDLKAFLEGERPELDGRGFAGITEAPPRKPLIAAVEGHALAGGCELALACDLIVAADDAVFGLPEVTRGLVAGSGGLVRLPERIPAGVAMEHALTGARFTAADAYRWGLVNRLASPGEALAEAHRLAEAILTNAPLAVEATKRIVRESARYPADELWSRQRALVEGVLATDDAREGAVAFAQKRAPVWRGT